MSIARRGHVAEIIGPDKDVEPLQLTESRSVFQETSNLKPGTKSLQDYLNQANDLLNLLKDYTTIGKTNFICTVIIGRTNMYLC